MYTTPHWRPPPPFGDGSNSTIFGTFTLEIHSSENDYDAKMTLHYSPQITYKPGGTKEIHLEGVYEGTYKGRPLDMYSFRQKTLTPMGQIFLVRLCQSTNMPKVYGGELCCIGPSDSVRLKNVRKVVPKELKDAPVEKADEEVSAEKPKDAEEAEEHE